MLNSIELNNFGKHRNLAVTFDAGLSAIRGENEAGKSTLLRAIAYALLGSGALPQSLEETVTWGEPVQSLSVRLTLTLDGVEYHVKRGKSGAELRYDGGVVTGQTDVTKFLCEQMGVDARSAMYLVIANQNALRGALEEGPAKTAALIETLANMEDVDRILELVREELPTGNTGVQEAALESAQARLDDLKDQPEVDVKILEADVHALKVSVSSFSEKHDNLSAQEVAARTEFHDLQGALAAYRRSLKEAETLRANLSRASTELVDLKSAAPKYTVEELDSKVASVTEQMVSLKSRKASRATYERFLQDLERVKKAETMGSTRFTEAGIPMPTSERAVQTEVKSLKTSCKDLDGKLRDMRDEVKDLERAKLNGSCSFCGQDFSVVPEVAAKNDAIDAKITAITESVEKTKRELSASESRRDLYEELSAAMASVQDVALRYGEQVNYSTSDAFHMEWVGDVPEQVEDVNYEAVLDSLRSDRRAAQKHQDELTYLQRSVATLQEDYQKAAAALEGVETVSQEQVDKQQATLDALSEQVQIARKALGEVKVSLAKAESDIKHAVEMQAMRQRELESARKTVIEAKARIDELKFNNELLKAVRSARPKVADALWNIVLSAVSAYFTEMRGEQSTVSKDKDGFKINDKPVEAYSGSTLDILGLAIRVALVRTFLPTAPFLVLDEPAAACSENRTHNMMAFLAGSDMAQILYVSHTAHHHDVTGSLVEIA